MNEIRLFLKQNVMYGVKNTTLAYFLSSDDTTETFDVYHTCQTGDQSTCRCSLLSKKRFIALNEKTFVDRFLCCKLCSVSFSYPDLMPKLLPCHHSFCLPCLEKMLPAGTSCVLVYVKRQQVFVYLVTLILAMLLSNKECFLSDVFVLQKAFE